MKMKTKQELKDEGFIYIATNENGLELWARFTGWLDCIQFIDYKEGVYTGDIQVTTFGRLVLFEEMYRKMLQYPQVNQKGYLENMSEKWMDTSK